MLQPLPGRHSPVSSLIADRVGSSVSLEALKYRNVSSHYTDRPTYQGSPLLLNLISLTVLSLYG